MPSDEKMLLIADGMLVDGKYNEAISILRNLITISPDNLSFDPPDFNLQKLYLSRIKRMFVASGNTVPGPLEKLNKYYDIVSRNHPGDTIELSVEESKICPLVLDWMPSISDTGEVSEADEGLAAQIVAGIIYLLETNKAKYKLGAFFRKGF